MDTVGDRVEERPLLPGQKIARFLFVSDDGL
jgi:hypothetical protein